jgi:hypothetical protein
MTLGPVKVSFGPLSNAVETAWTWYKPQWHLPAVDICISQTIGDGLKHLDLGVTALRKAIRRPVIEVI